MTCNIVVEQDVVIPMRDGTRTMADVIRPDDGGRHPVVLQRSIYGKEGYLENAYSGPLDLARAGYAFVSQDCRGCGKSEGYLDFAFQEQDDGYDSVEWAGRQPWSSGKVGVTGNSALTMTAYQAVAAQPPSLAAAFVVDGHTDMESWTKRAGVPSEVYFGVPFTASIILRNNLYRLDLDEDGRSKLLDDLAAAFGATRDDLLRLPVFDFDALSDDCITSGLKGIFLAEPTDPLWKKDATALGKQPGRARVPIKAIAGIYSPFAETMAQVWAARPELGHELIMGPWGHFGAVGEPYGVYNYQAAPAGGARAWSAQRIAWFDRWLKDGPSSEVPPSKMYYFLSGENKWAATDRWPPAGTKLELFLAKGSGEGMDAGDGGLIPQPPDHAGTNRYVYDPLDPVPTVGGVLIDFGSTARFDPTFTADGPHDQRRIECRTDVLLYTSQTLEEPVRLVGCATADLWIDSSAEDTDFIVRLVDVQPDGVCANIAEGVVRARYRNGRNDAWLVPGRPEELAITLDPATHCFMPGHRIRVHVTSSSFPKYTRNLNTRAVPERGTEKDAVKAEQTIYHGGERPSRITLHVVPPSEEESPYVSRIVPRPPS